MCVAKYVIIFELCKNLARISRNFLHNLLRIPFFARIGIQTKVTATLMKIIFHLAAIQHPTAMMSEAAVNISVTTPIPAPR